ncbi:hypothetical protein HanRHA438_Chr06g0250421 [Helianthus annuus]|uniref:Uncharacterized protein n=1 Tax=Helianthus annuus TaxID=4232 RepID=A0A251TIE2_HELAN|nr:hypothetical protein HanXRQr2_Chr06g0241381 [Helianthus annuus]KAJ0910266.1 hypothetical protein HanRHA438_Chr06g0250421 [Helianthus annuus]KAJ0913935.1 hypothetical protein HanPSC8_Chr06g0232941 [Helianthus annuus]
MLIDNTSSTYSYVAGLIIEPYRSVEEEIRPRFPCPYCYADFKELTYSLSGCLCSNV